MKNSYDNKLSVLKNMRDAWTMIEFILIIVIVGILISLALPRLAATRDDAKLSTIVRNMGVCVRDIQTYYTATGVNYTQTNYPISCSPNKTTCYTIMYPPNNGLASGELNVTTNPIAASYCRDIDNVGGHVARFYKFGGQGISRE